MRAFWARKLFELSGLLPLGAWLIAQLLAGARALGPGGEARFDAAAAPPSLGWAVVLGLPLLYHAAYGLRLLRATRPNAGAYPSLRNWAYVLQRASALVLLLFFAYHLSRVLLYPLLHPDDPLLQRAGGDAVVTARYLRHVLAGAHGGLPVEWIYRAGVAAAAFHFANGLWSLAVHWGLLIGRRAQRAASWATAAVGLALLALGERVISALLAGGA
jgi:succinate dehydrogenase/fumarate reductase cytochrome b subunit